MTKNEFITNLQLMLEEYAVDENADAVGLSPNEMVKNIKMFQGYPPSEGLIVSLNDGSEFKLEISKIDGEPLPVCRHIGYENKRVCGDCGQLLR